MLTTPTKRPSPLLAAGLLAAGIGAAAPSPAAQAAEIGGTLFYEEGDKIPEGRIEIMLETGAGNSANSTGTRLESSGSSKAIAFSVPAPDQAAAPQILWIVARLERADGWLLARGSAKVEPGAPVDITLFRVMY
ncbi:hypothetical protein [Roseibium sediminicola]|uniref:Uncharacterized protein n=1 Tax=Roseibium sediminicola TaxID=2933272 RepID=A0ABT0GP33_9HYPH|nr:hypothetical protein [Roseibium sp. CAU 1639]MCK7611178.1 hypothetical protein [Roseibium sp. CAU 1639]